MEAAKKLNNFKKRRQQDETAGQFLQALKNLATKESGGCYEVQVVKQFKRGVKYPDIKDKLRVMKNIPSLAELEYMCTNTPSLFDGLSRYSIDLVYEKVFLSLDEISLKNCLKVCQKWRRIIERIKPAKPVDGFTIYAYEMREMAITREVLQNRFEEEPEVQEKCEERAQEMTKCYLQMYPKLKGCQFSSVENGDHVSAVDWMLALLGETFPYKPILTEDQIKFSLDQRNVLETLFQRTRQVFSCITLLLIDLYYIMQ